MLMNLGAWSLNLVLSAWGCWSLKGSKTQGRGNASGLWQYLPEILILKD
jgi:hypothetical protein